MNSLLAGIYVRRRLNESSERTFRRIDRLLQNSRLQSRTAIAEHAKDRFYTRSLSRLYLQELLLLPYFDTLPKRSPVYEKTIVINLQLFNYDFAFSIANTSFLFSIAAAYRFLLSLLYVSSPSPRSFNFHLTVSEQSELVSDVDDVVSR